MSTELATGRSGIGVPGSTRLLVVASPDAASKLAESLRGSGLDVVECDSAESGCAALAEQACHMVFVDPVHRAVAIAAADQGIPAIAVDPGSEAVGSTYLASMSSGAASAAPLLVELVLDRHHLRQQVQELENLVEGLRDGSALIGRSPQMRRLQSALSRAAEGDATVLIEGAPGVGKSVAARVIHCKSRRGNRPLIVRAAAELDGDAMQAALVAAADSTLIIEDVDQLPQAGQQALVKFLKERSSGADGTPPRAVATTSSRLPELVARGAFREDLYYRLNSYPIVVPSLRERVEDITQLAESLLDHISSSTNQRPAGFTAAARDMLESLPWPGNVAQLENVVRRAFLQAGGEHIDERHLTQPAGTTVAPKAAAAAVVVDDPEDLSEDDIRPFDEEEQRLLSRALRATRGNVRRAAQLLGIGRATLYRKIQQYKLRLQ